MALGKKVIKDEVDGSTELFQFVSDYTDGTVEVLEIKADGSVVDKNFTPFDGGYLHISPAPQSGSRVLILYEYVEDSDGVMSQWEKENLRELLDLIKLQGNKIKYLEDLLSKKVAKGDFNAWAEAIEDKLKLI